jgi:hypothetical protein
VSAFELACLVSPWLALLALALWDVRDRDPKSERRYERALVNWTKVLGLSTACLVAATVYSAVILNETDHTLKDTLESSGRAWIAPRALVFIEQPTIGKPFHLKMNYENTGKEPARDILFNHKVEIGKLIDMPDGGKALYVAPNQTCDGLNPFTGGSTAYPSTNKDYEISFYGDGNKVFTAEVENFPSRAIVNACFAYSSFGKKRHSAICFLLQRSDSMPVTWIWSFCPSGNRAE